ncbi:MAG TPA: hypothetical protein VFW50_18355 [Streptosporangiaceae bacterium]|nr:hypothetical protein [Streptosporangiaceae bacterium]
MPPSMSRAEREEFLAGVHVGVLSVASTYARETAFEPDEWHRRATRDGSFLAFIPELTTPRVWSAASSRSRAWRNSSPCSSARRPAATASARP